MSSILHVKVATTEYLLLTDPIPGAVIDGVSLSIGDRVLVKTQGPALHIEHGIYQVHTDYSLVRVAEMDTGDVIDAGQLVVVQKGTLFENTGWILVTTNATATIGTHTLRFERFTVQSNIFNDDMPSSIVLRAEKGTVLTIDELDNNFRFLVNGIVNKVNVSDYTSATICGKINEVDYNISSINAKTLRGYAPDANGTASTLALRNADNKIASAAFIGALEGNAATATFANTSTLAGNVTGIVAIANGGTGSSTATNARIALGVVGIGGVDSGAMTGKLNLMATTGSTAPLNIGVGPDATTVNHRSNGDLWAASDLRYKLNDALFTIAKLESPAFTGLPTAPNPGYSSNTTVLATTKFVQDHHVVIDAALALKAPIASPSLTGTPLSTTPTIDDNSTRIATTNYTRSYVAAVVPTLPSVTGKVSKAGDTMTGPLILSAHPTSESPALQAVTKGHLDTKTPITTYGTVMLSDDLPNGEVFPPNGYIMSNLKGFLPAFGSTVQTPVRNNLILIIDNSGSATSGSCSFNGTTYATSLLAEIAAAKYLVNYYAAIGTTAVCIYYSNNTAGQLYKWTNAADAIVLLTSGSSSGFSSGSIATAFGLRPQIANNNMCYFLSDAEHSILPGFANGGTEAVWKGFLNANSITSFAVAIGNTGNPANINTIAWDGKTSTELSGIQVATLDSIPKTLSTSIYYNAGNIAYSLQSDRIVISYAGTFNEITTVSVNWLAIWAQ